MAAILTWTCDVCKALMRTSLPALDGPASPKNKPLPAICAGCGTPRMLLVAANQPLVDVKTEAVKPQ